MLKETETEETIVFFVTFLSLVAFQLGGGEPPRPTLATPMNSSIKLRQIKKHHRLITKGGKPPAVWGTRWHQSSFQIVSKHVAQVGVKTSNVNNVLIKLRLTISYRQYTEFYRHNQAFD